MQSIDTAALDATIVAFGWIAGASLFLVGTAIAGFVFWWASDLRRPSLPKLAARFALSLVGAAALTGGTMLLGIGTEACFGYPLGDSSGATVLVGYLLGARLLVLELATSHGLMRRLAEERESVFHDALVWTALAAGAIAWLMFAALSCVCAIVLGGLLANVAGLGPG